MRLQNSLFIVAAMLASSPSPVLAFEASAESWQQAEKCSALHVSGPVAVELSVKNQTAEKARWVWLDLTTRTTKLYAELAPGEEISQPSYAGHFWLLLTGLDRVEFSKCALPSEKHGRRRR